jgi:hypothetical protein
MQGVICRAFQIVLHCERAVVYIYNHWLTV